MDKERKKRTWVSRIICLTVVAVVFINITTLALDSVNNGMDIIFLQGFKNNESTAIHPGAYYIDLTDNTFYNEMPDTAGEGDTYLYGEYIYIYQPEIDGWHVLLATEDLGLSEIFYEYKWADRNQTAYSSFLRVINNKPVVSLNHTFENCTVLETAPVIPANIKYMTGAFSGCVSLKGNIEINAKPTEYLECFKDTTEKITITGSTDKKSELALTANNGNVGYINEYTGISRIIYSVITMFKEIANLSNYTDIYY